MALQVIYSSQAAAPMSVVELEQILVDAREGNARRGVTGALVYVEGVFLQILEGPEAAVRGLMGRIAKDTRHTALKVVHEAEVDPPMFHGWKMAYLTPTPGEVAAWLGLEGAASLEALLAEVHQAPTKAPRVAQGILNALSG